MNLTDLKTKPIDELIHIATETGLENLGRSRKQDIIFSILKKHAKSGEDIYIEVPPGTVVMDAAERFVLKDLAAAEEQVVAAKGG